MEVLILIIGAIHFTLSFPHVFFYKTRRAVEMDKLKISDLIFNIIIVIAGEVPRPDSPGDAVIRGEDGRPVAQWMLRGETQ